MQNFKQLKAYQRGYRDNWAQGINLRVHRALSWLQKAEKERESKDLDGEFIALWIAFNAAYANDYDNEIRTGARDTFQQFINRLVTYDQDRELYNVIWTHYPAAIRSFMNNEFVFQPYWDSINGRTDPGAWKEPFEKAKHRANQALAEQEIAVSLSILLDRMYTLRNQLIHGGATYGSSLNRKQLKNATEILGQIIPIMIKLMMKNAHDLWAPAIYFHEQPK